ncbi:MAG: hypothetical protein K2X38_13245 [Gemmataceae bacterium]|nr:hypothetical protein [Gemmataceae bacterium]
MFRLRAFLAILASLAALRSASADDVGFLKSERKGDKGAVEQEVFPYMPREGDLIFYDDRHPVWSALFAFAGTGSPLHMGIVVKKPGGKLAVLEAGPDDSVRVKLLDIEKRLPQFHNDFKGLIQVRRCKKMLAEEDSKALTKFAVAQDGKGYAVGRLLLQGTPFRERGRKDDLAKGKTILDRDRWICSELAVAAGTVAKLFDPKAVHSNVAYPRDLVDNARHDLSGSWHNAAVWVPK